MTHGDWPTVQAIYAAGMPPATQPSRRARRPGRSSTRAGSRTTGSSRSRRARSSAGQLSRRLRPAPATQELSNTRSTSRSELKVAASGVGCWRPFSQAPKRPGSGRSRRASSSRTSPASSYTSVSASVWSAGGSGSHSRTASGATRSSSSAGSDGGYVPFQRRNTTQALWPPKPNELETPISTCCGRVSFGM